MISFAQPASVGWLAVSLVVAVLMVAQSRRVNRLKKQWGDEVLVNKLARLSPRWRGLKSILKVFALVLWAVVLMGPHWGHRFEEVKRRGVDVIIAVDVSASMMAEDIKPSRLVQAKRLLGRLIDGLEGDRVGVVAFAGQAFLQCPLTLDREAARSILELVSPDLIPVPGTNIASALDVSLDAFVRTEQKHKALVLLTDGEDHSGKLSQAVERAAAQGTRIWALGLGNPEGEVVPLKGEDGTITGYKKDDKGNTVVSRLNEDSLRNAADKTGGRYFRATPGESELDSLLEEVRNLEKKDLSSAKANPRENHYQVFLLGVILLLILEQLLPEAPGPRATGVLLLLLLFPFAAHSEETPEAMYNRGVTFYRHKDFPASSQAFDQARNAWTGPQRARAAYNAGNAFVRQGQLDRAVDLYKETLRLTPQDEDARHNLEFVLRLRQAKPPKDKNKKEEDKKSSPQPTPGQLSREDAQRLLDALKDQEEKARRQAQARPDKPPPSVKEDW